MYRLLIFLFAISFGFLMPLPYSFASDTQAVKPTMIQGKVAATPISIPRPIILEALPKPQPAEPIPGMQPIQAHQAYIAPKITDCKVQSMSGNEMLLRLSYTLPKSQKPAVFTGAFIYSSRREAVNAGYKPLQIQIVPKGMADLTMVMPKTPFQGAYIETFLIREGKIITKSQFKFPFAWDGSNGSFLISGAVIQKDPAMSMDADAKKAFCQNYADNAVQQFRLGAAHHLPGVVPPGWSDDQAGHYNWCMKVPKAISYEEDYKRVQHLKKHLPPATLQNLKKTNQLPALNPGRGP